MNGEIIYLSLYSVNERFSEQQLKGLFKNPQDASKYEGNRPEPEEVSLLEVPVVFNFKDVTPKIDLKEYRFKIQVAIYKAGVFSLRIRHVFTNIENEALLDLSFDQKIKSAIRSEVEKVKAKVLKELSDEKDCKLDGFEESYRFYYIEGDSATLTKKYSKIFTGLLIDERNVEKLDSAYVDDVLNKKISYNSDDAFFVGWESSIMIDVLKSYEQELLVAELANLELLEMRILDRTVSSLINTTEEIATREKPNIINRFFGKEGRETKRVYFKLGNFYNDMRARVSEINDNTFDLGEWYLTKLYALFSKVFKLDEWGRVVERDLEIIDKRRDYISSILRSDYEDALELIVIILIVVEILIALFPLFNIHL